MAWALYKKKNFKKLLLTELTRDVIVWYAGKRAASHDRRYKRLFSE